MYQAYEVSKKKKKENWIFSIYFCQTNLFPVHHSSCILVFYYLSFDLLRHRERSGGLVISLPRQWSLSSPISRKGPALAEGGASLTWRSASRLETPPPIIIWRAMAPRRRWATTLTSLFNVWQFHSYLAAT